MHSIHTNRFGAPKVEYLEPEMSDKRLAYCVSTPNKPAQVGVLYLGGLKSDMLGTKASSIALDQLIHENSNCIRFDYRGHGNSSGVFEEMSLCEWFQDATDIIDYVCKPEPQILVGASIGAWIAIMAALARPNRVRALILIAPAVDITEFWWRRMSAEERKAASQSGKVPLRSDYNKEGDYLTMGFYEKARQMLVMRGGPGSIKFINPVRIFHGMRDTIVPPAISRELVEKLASEDVHITLVKDGDHRLSRPQDVSAILASLQELIDVVTACPESGRVDCSYLSQEPMPFFQVP